MARVDLMVSPALVGCVSRLLGPASLTFSRALNDFQSLAAAGPSCANFNLLHLVFLVNGLNAIINALATMEASVEDRTSAVAEAV